VVSFVNVFTRLIRETMQIRETMDHWRSLLRKRQKVPAHLRLGRLGERIARRFLRRRGFKLLAANFKTKRGEIDLIFRDRHTLVFVEVKTRSDGGWGRPADAVNREKRLHLSKAALDYLKRLRYPLVTIRFDIVEVLMAGETPREIRHVPNAFTLSDPFRYL
jgi:putative endonuclease